MAMVFDGLAFDDCAVLVATVVVAFFYVNEEISAPASALRLL